METVISPATAGATVVDTDRRGHGGHGGHGDYGYRRDFGHNDSDWSRGAERVKDALTQGLALGAAERNQLAFRSVDQVSQILLAIEQQRVYLQASFDAVQAKMAAEVLTVREQLKQSELEALKDEIRELKAAARGPRTLPA